MTLENEDLQKIADHVFGAVLQREKVTEDTASGQIRVGDILHAAKIVTKQDIKVDALVDALKNATTPSKDIAALAAAIRRWERFGDLPEASRVAVGIAHTRLSGGEAFEGGIKLVETLRSFVKYMKTFKKQKVRAQLITTFEEICAHLENAKSGEERRAAVNEMKSTLWKLTKLGDTSGFEKELCELLKTGKFLKDEVLTDLELNRFAEDLVKFTEERKQRDETAAAKAEERALPRETIKATAEAKDALLLASEGVSAGATTETSVIPGETVKDLLPLVLNAKDAKEAASVLYKIFEQKNPFLSLKLLQDLFSIADRGISRRHSGKEISMLRGVLNTLNEKRFTDPIKKVIDLIKIKQGEESPDEPPVSSTGLYTWSVTVPETWVWDTKSLSQKQAASLAEKIPPETHINLLGNLAQHILLKKHWENQGFFRKPGALKTVNSAQVSLYGQMKQAPNRKISAIIQGLDVGEGETGIASLFKSCFEMCEEQFDTKEAFINALKNDKAAWDAVSELLTSVATTGVTKLTYQTLADAFPHAREVIKLVQSEAKQESTQPLSEEEDPPSEPISPPQ